MRTLNRFGEPIFQAVFLERPAALRFAKMIAANPARFSITGVVLGDGGWVVSYRSRKDCPWRRDQRAPKGVA